MYKRPFLRILGLSAQPKAATELKFLHRRVLLYHTFKLSHLFPFLTAYARSKRRLCPDKSVSRALASIWMMDAAHAHAHYRCVVRARRTYATTTDIIYTQSGTIQSE